MRAAVNVRQMGILAYFFSLRALVSSSSVGSLSLLFLTLPHTSALTYPSLPRTTSPQPQHQPSRPPRVPRMSYTRAFSRALHNAAPGQGNAAHQLAILVGEVFDPGAAQPL
ncbi:hypothetical protein B0H13DRAFT_2312116 [Mycena leptocephala]|nr:hypothetical protein B0H13DRAFT_2312116 [Mycena leptocephala]